MKRFTTILSFVAFTVMATFTPLIAADTTPSFDCTKASSLIEQLICKTPALAALDRQMVGAYDKAMKSWPADEVTKEKAAQISWLNGRNACSKTKDQVVCVEDAYKKRIVELQITGGQLMAPSPVEYQCGDNSTPLTATFYQTDPMAVVLTDGGGDQVIAWATQSGSGAKYTAKNVEFWEHHGEATVKWNGKDMTCTEIPSHGND